MINQGRSNPHQDISLKGLLLNQFPDAGTSAPESDKKCYKNPSKNHNYFKNAIKT